MVVRNAEGKVLVHHAVQGAKEGSYVGEVYAEGDELFVFVELVFIEVFFFFVFSWVKATVPRYRYDQLMRLGWKIFLPTSLFFVFLVSGFLMLTRYGGAQ